MTSRALTAYLEEVDRHLKGPSRTRKRFFLRELEGHLLDEAEARGIVDEGAMESLLREKETPAELAAELSSEDRVDASHRNGAALLSGSVLGLATGGYLLLQVGWPWHLGLAFGLAHGLAVGTGIFWVRSQWQRLGPRVRLLIATLLGTLLAIPLGFTTMRGFVLTRLSYGGFTGYLLERHAQKRPLWQLVLEVLLFTCFDYAMEVLVLHRVLHYQGWMELSFNLTLALAVMAALRLRLALSKRWVLRSQGLC